MLSYKLHSLTSILCWAYRAIIHCQWAEGLILVLTKKRNIYIYIYREREREREREVNEVTLGVILQSNLIVQKIVS